MTWIARTLCCLRVECNYLLKVKWKSNKNAMRVFIRFEGETKGNYFVIYWYAMVANKRPVLIMGSVSTTMNAVIKPINGLFSYTINTLFKTINFRLISVLYTYKICSYYRERVLSAINQSKSARLTVFWTHSWFKRGFTHTHRKRVWDTCRHDLLHFHQF